jgi:enediyne biosynthesis protein E4
VNRVKRSLPFLATIAALAGCKKADAPAVTPAWLADRARQEQAIVGKSQTFHDFKFTNGLAASGITFVEHIVEDAGKDYKAVHYDHGTGIAAADVDGDGLPDLFFVSQLGTCELWKNLGGGKFTNITASSGINLTDAIAVGASFADIDNDGDPDLFVTTVRHGNHLFENMGGGKFRDISEQAGVAYVGHSSGAVFFDYDRDGKLDLFVTNVGVYTSDDKGPGGFYKGLRDAFHGHTHPERAESSILYHNEGGNRFKDVTQQTQLVDLSWSGDATIMDANADGFLDLYVLDMQGEDHLWLNDAGKRFHEATESYFPRTSWGGMGVKVFDFDGDGRLDVYVTDMHSDMFVNVPGEDWGAEVHKSDPSKIPADFLPGGASRLVFGNSLFARRGTSFVEVSDSVGAETYWPWGPSVDDLNADGFEDAFVTAGMSFPFRYAPNSLLLNEGGKRFLPAEFALGVEPRASLEKEWFKLDCNGADANHLYCKACSAPDGAARGCRGGQNGQYTVLGSRSSRSSVILDIDGDGDLDIVTNDFNDAPQILISDLSARRHVNAIKVSLRGTTSNREGLGAVVVLELPDHRRIVKLNDGKSGYLSMSVLPLYFGLGDADHASSIEVYWPSGKRQTVAGPIAAGKPLEIVER